MRNASLPGAPNDTAVTPLLIDINLLVYLFAQKQPTKQVQAQRVHEQLELILKAGSRIIQLVKPDPLLLVPQTQKHGTSGWAHS
jgi:hypothetical protein